MSPIHTSRVRSAAMDGVAVTVEHEARTVYIYVPRRTKNTTDEEFAGMIEEMSRARREWQGRDYRIEFIR